MHYSVELVLAAFRRYECDGLVFDGRSAVLLRHRGLNNNEKTSSRIRLISWRVAVLNNKTTQVGNNAPDDGIN